MAVNLTDYIPHGMVAALAGLVTYVFREHTKQDDARFGEIKTSLDTIEKAQGVIVQKMADNHTEILKLFITAQQAAAHNAALAEVADNDARHARGSI